MAIAVTGRIPNGSIEVVAADDPRDIRLRLLPDCNDSFMGYYHFKASGVRGTDCRFSIINAGDSLSMRLPGRENVEDGWTNTGPCVSYDRRYWFRVPAAFDGKVFSFHLCVPRTTSVNKRDGVRQEPVRI